MFFKVCWVTEIFSKVVRVTEIFPKFIKLQKNFLLKVFHSFKLIIFNIVTKRFCPAYSSHDNFLATMPRRDKVGDICQPFNSGSGDNDRLEFFCCVGSKMPQILEVWTFGVNEITREVHPFARVDISAFSRDCLGLITL